MINRQALEAAISAAEAPELLALAGELQGRAWAAALARLAVRTPEAPAPACDQLLTYAVAAELLGTSKNYVEVLARQRKIPTVRLPGLDEQGRARAGKQVRIRVEDLREVVSKWTDKGLDRQAYATYSSECEGNRGSADSQKAGPHATSVGRTARSRRKLRGSLGAQRDGDEIDGAEAPTVTSSRNEE